MTAANNQVGGNHYKDFAIQPYEYIEKNKLTFLEGCAIKYITRWRLKNGLQDLDKAIHCLQLLRELNTQKSFKKEAEDFVREYYERME